MLQSESLQVQNFQQNSLIMLKNAHFVKSFSTLYGKEYISDNVHNLLHLCNDVRKYGPLDVFSAFKFENFMQSIKKLVRKSELLYTLQQVYKRYVEQEIKIIEEFSLPKQNFDKSHFETPVFDIHNASAQFKIYQTENIEIDCNNPKDKYIKLKCNTFIMCRNFIHCLKQKKYFVFGHALSPIKSVYNTPCNSEILNIHTCKVKLD